MHGPPMGGDFQSHTLWVWIFTHDSYACRAGKGVHKALERVRGFMRQGTRNGQLPLYALHLDVKNYFVSIDRRILANLIEDRLVKEARCSPRPELSFLNCLAQTFLRHNPLEQRIDKGDRQLQGTLASYYGHFKWADTSRLRRSVFRRYPWLHGLFRLDRNLMPRVLRFRTRMGLAGKAR